MSGDEDAPIFDPLAHAQKKLGLPALRRVVKRAKQDALYDLELDDGTIIPIGPISSLKDPRKVEDAIGSATDCLPPYISGPKFRPIANCLLAIAELEDSGATPDAVTRGWIAGHTGGGRLALAEPVDLRDSEARGALFAGYGDGDGPPIFHDTDGRLYLRLAALEDWVRITKRVPLTTRDLSARLARLGFEKVLIEGPRDETGKKVGRGRYWRSPADFDPSDEG